eukprot:TCALIF_11674-PA protein Name:"Protein of unknown function" AED:0.05 eAED:0.05 QI:67/1/0.5/1/1/1/2/48/78
MPGPFGVIRPLIMRVDGGRPRCCPFSCPKGLKLARKLILAMILSLRSSSYQPKCERILSTPCCKRWPNQLAWKKRTLF